MVENPMLLRDGSLYLWDDDSIRYYFAEDHCRLSSYCRTTRMAPGHLIRATLPDKADSVLSADVDIATSRMALLLSSPRKGWRVAVTTIGDHWVTPYIHEHRIEDPIGADLRPREPQILPPPPREIDNNSRCEIKEGLHFGAEGSKSFSKCRTAEEG